MSAGDQRIKAWPQLKGSVLPYEFNFSPFIEAHGLTLDTITASSDKASVATVTDRSVLNGQWTGEITAVGVGTADITLTATFINSNIKRLRKFIVDVTDPDH